MRRLRDIFYLYNYPEKNYALYYGMEFREFIKCEPNNIKNILLLNTEFLNSVNYDYNNNTSLVYIDEKSMNQFLTEDHYDFGDFGWIDFDEHEKLNSLKPNEVAELLYLGHKFKPVSSPFFDKIDNRYAYLAHDDGWFCKFHYKYINDLKEIVANKVVQTTSSIFKKRKIYPISDEIKEQLLNLCNDGLVINFSCVTKSNRGINILLHTIGEFLNMDDMYNDLNKHINKSNNQWWLIYKNKQWKIEKW